MATEPATAVKPVEQKKIYDAFARWLSQQDEQAFYVQPGPCRKDLGKNDDEKKLVARSMKYVPSGVLKADYADVTFLTTCWADGVIEFARCEHSFGYHGDDKGAIRTNEDGAKLGFAWIDGQPNRWTGLRKPGMKSLKEMLEEDAELPATVVRQEKVQDEATKAYRVVKIQFPGQVLRLQVRLTEKGWAHLAA